MLWKPITAHYPEHTIPIMKHCGDIIMLCGCVFLQWGQGNWSVYEIMDGVIYQPILKENLLQFSKDLRLGWKFTFQQGNTAKHTARAKMERFRSKHINALE